MKVGEGAIDVDASDRLPELCCDGDLDVAILDWWLLVVASSGTSLLVTFEVYQP